MPPDSQIDDQVQAGGLIGELAFMDDQAGVGLAVADVLEDLVEGDEEVGESGQRAAGSGQ